MEITQLIAMLSRYESIDEIILDSKHIHITYKVNNNLYMDRYEYLDKYQNYMFIECLKIEKIEN